MKGSRTFLIITISLMLVLTASCTPAATTEPTAIPEEPTAVPAKPTAVPEEPTAIPEPELEDVTLTIWFLSYSPEDIALVTEQMNQWATGYDKANVTIELSPYGWEEMNNAMRLALDSKTGPDVAMASPGKDYTIAYAEEGHLVDLTEFMAERGIDQHFSEGFIKFYNPTGRIYAMPYESVTMGIFYNGDIFNELGLKPPSTFEEFEELVATLQAAGYAPFPVGGLDRFPLTQILDQFLHGNVPWEDLTKIIYGDPEGQWNSPEMLEATEKFSEWFELGYFDPNALAISFADSRDMFLTGESPLFIAGSWSNITFNEQADFEVRFFPMPQMNPDLDWHMGGYTPNNMWQVPVYGEHTEIALDLLEFILGEQMARARWNAGATVAYQFDPVPAPSFPLQGDVYAAMQVTQLGEYLVQNSEVYDAYETALQELIAGEKTAQEILDELQAKHLEVLE